MTTRKPFSTFSWIVLLTISLNACTFIFPKPEGNPDSTPQEKTFRTEKSSQEINQKTETASKVTVFDANGSFLTTGTLIESSGYTCVRIGDASHRMKNSNKEEFRYMSIDESIYVK